MGNLFVIHTQYNLILATGIALYKKEDSSDLILFCDFSLTDSIKQKLFSVYKNVLILNGNYPRVEMSSKAKLKKIEDDCDKISKFIKKSYDEIIVVDDMCIQEMYALKCASYYNRAIKMSWLEDGGNAYFDIGVKSGGMGSTPLKRFIRKLFFSIKFNLGNFYDLGSCMGTHRLLKNIYVLFPEAVRREHMDQGKILITEEEFSKGMEFIYKDKPIALLGNGVLIAMDKIDVYGDMKSNVNDFIKEIVQNETRLGNTVLYKYHPRETDSLQALHSCQELDRTVALESYLVNSEARNLTIIGFKSTALQTAKKMGYETISYIKQLEPNNNAVIDFYKSIGIICK